VSEWATASDSVSQWLTTEPNAISADMACSNFPASPAASPNSRLKAYPLHTSLGRSGLAWLDGSFLSVQLPGSIKRRRKSS
jgi:hypothetical protein